MIPVKSLPFVMAMLASLVFSAAVNAAGSGDYGGSSSSKAKSSDVIKAEKMIRSGRYAEAYPLLQQEVGKDADNADIHNLLGYSARKLENYDASMAHYSKALAIDPEHKGALEYMGELYLTLDQPDEAEKLLARLEKICWLGCDEEDELRQALADWKAKQ